VIALFSLSSVYSQSFSAEDFLFPSAFTSKKFENYLDRKKFFPSDSRFQHDTVVRVYSLKMKIPKKKKDTIRIIKKVETYRANNTFSFAYLTSLKNEYNESLRELKEEGFFCGNQSDTGIVLFQKRTLSVLVKKITKPDTDTMYSFYFHEEILPLPETIHYAEDLLKFKSHEYLAAFFGQANVIKDVYYFSEKDIAKCSVLFPKTSRQAVIIWEDQVNLYKPSYLIIGGNTNTGSSATYDGVIDENVWSSKEGVYSGMSLVSLIKLNGNSFRFYGKNASVPYMVVPENTGTLNFRKKMIVLGCLNPSGSRLLNNATVSAEEILNDNLGIYVFMMMILPTSAGNNEKL
jgi:hypothetical protein